tara:strand:+ start:27 stop:158 length:132 start_codon:yes stop_codon:yes gene_type:complete
VPAAQEASNNKRDETDSFFIGFVPLFYDLIIDNESLDDEAVDS